MKIIKERIMGGRLKLLRKWSGGGELLLQRDWCVFFPFSVSSNDSNRLYQLDTDALSHGVRCIGVLFESSGNLETENIVYQPLGGTDDFGVRYFFAFGIFILRNEQSYIFCIRAGELLRDFCVGGRILQHIKRFEL